MLGEIFSVTNLVSVAFLAYMGNSVFTLGKFWFPETCPEDADFDACIRPMVFEDEQLFTTEIFFTEKKPSSHQSKKEQLIYKKEDLNLSEDLFEEKINVTLPHSAMNNATFWSRVILYPTGKRQLATQAFGRMISYQVPIRYANLLGDENAKDIVYDTMGHFRSKLEFNVMNEDIAFPRQSIPGEAYRFLSLDKDQVTYKRMLYVSELNFRLDELKEIEESEQELTIRYRPFGIGKLRLLVNMERSLLGFTDMGFQEKDIDDVKGLLVDTEMYILLMTFIVSAFHILFDALAFKNDVSYWRNRETMAGLSIRTVGFQMVSTVIIFVHLLHEDTSLLVSAPMGISCFIECWKFIKALRLRNNEGQSETEEYDADFMKKLSYVLWPLCIGGAVYSLFYVPHKSWYGWVLQSLVNGVYAFGFLFMLPQLFINYKLKSVAHLPWRAFMYKAFNTFIDDVFAFIIKMPTTHRIACFRDDIVFFCYLYQRYLYPVDKSRINEFGFSAESDAESDGEREVENEVNDEVGSGEGEAPAVQKTLEEKKDE